MKEDNMPKDTIKQEFIKKCQDGDFAMDDFDNEDWSCFFDEEKIADWWLNKFESHYSDIAKKIREMKKTESSKGWENDGLIFYSHGDKQSYNSALTDVLSLLSPSSDNNKQNEKNS